MATPSRPCLIGSEEAFELLEGLQQATAPGAEVQQQPGVLVPGEAQAAGGAAAPGQAVATFEALPSSPTASPAVHSVEGLDNSQTPGHVLLPVPVSPPSDPATHGEQHQEAAVAEPLRATTSAAQAYLSECRVVQADPHRRTLELLNTVPESLRVPFQPRVMPRTHAGAAWCEPACLCCYAAQMVTMDVMMRLDAMREAFVCTGFSEGTPESTHATYLHLVTLGCRGRSVVTV